MIKIIAGKIFPQYVVIFIGKFFTNNKGDLNMHEIVFVTLNNGNIASSSKHRVGVNFSS